MSFSRWKVDYGPVALPVGAGMEARVDVPQGDELESAACRLHDMLSRASSAGRTKHFERDPSQMNSDNESQSGEPPDEHDLGLEIERLWVCSGNGTVREVRLRLANMLIPDTWVRIFDQYGELHIELTASRDGTRQWLDRSSAKLAEDIGSRLQCAVRVIVQRAHDAEATCAVFHWEGSPTV
nr:hypothetical protein [uncultured Noviherbaspirillum sp.]